MFRLHWLFSIMCLICFILLIIIICGARIDSRALVMLGRHSVVELQFFYVFIFRCAQFSQKCVCIAYCVPGIILGSWAPVNRF